MTNEKWLGVSSFIDVYNTGGLRALHAALGGISGDQKLEILVDLRDKGFLVEWIADPADALRFLGGEVVAGPDGDAMPRLR